MEVIEPRGTMLTNQEVIELLTTTKSERDAKVALFDQTGQQHERRIQNHNTVVFETLKYLSTTSAPSQTRTGAVQLIKALKKFKLTPAETLQLVNLRPQQAIEVQLIVEECEERLSEEEVDELVQVIASHSTTASNTDPNG